MDLFLLSTLLLGRIKIFHAVRHDTATDTPATASAFGSRPLSSNIGPTLFAPTLPGESGKSVASRKALCAIAFYGWI